MDRLGIDAKVDFALAFAMVHEVPDQRRLLSEIFSCLKPDGKFLVAEPILHVPAKSFDKMTAIAEEIGFAVNRAPSRATLPGGGVWEEIDKPLLIDFF